MSFPTTSVISTFTGTDEDPISEGGIWTTGASVGFEGILGSQERISNQAGARSGNAIYNVTTYGPDVEVFETLAVLPTSGAGATFCYARLSALSTTPNGYSIGWRNAGGTPTMRMLRYDAGTGTDIGNWTQALSAGDKLGLEIIGSTLQAYVFTGGSWITSGSPITDATYSAAGYIGFGITDVNARIDDFGGGNAITVRDNTQGPVKQAKQRFGPF